MAEELCYIILEGNDLDKIKYFVENQSKYFDIDGSNYDGERPLEIACSNGYLEIVEYLISCGADINYVDEYSSPLLSACAGGHFDIVKYLVDYNPISKHKLNINSKTKIFFKTALMQACSRDTHGTSATRKGSLGSSESVQNDFHIVKYLIDHGADIHAKDRDGKTALMYACLNGNLEIVNYLIENGAEALINCADENGMTPLTIACRLKNFSLVKYLISHGADINYKNNVTREYNYHASRCGDEDLCKFFEGKGNDRLNELLNLLSEDQDEIKNQSINKIPERGRTALMYACESGDLEIIDHLISLGSDLYARDDLGRTPLMYACYMMRLDVIKYLIDLSSPQMSQINDRDDLGRTPLLISFYNSKLNVIQYLIDQGADINVKDRLGRGIEVYAQDYSYSKLDKYLAEKGVKLI